MADIQVGRIIYSGPHRRCKRTSWWYVYSDDGTYNSVMLERNDHPDWTVSFRNEFSETYWDEEVMREQGAKYVELDDVPAHILATLAKWKLING